MALHYYENNYIKLGLWDFNDIPYAEREDVNPPVEWALNDNWRAIADAINYIHLALTFTPSESQPAHITDKPALWVEESGGDKILHLANINILDIGDGTIKVNHIENSSGNILYIKDLIEIENDWLTLKEGGIRFISGGKISYIHNVDEVLIIDSAGDIRFGVGGVLEKVSFNYEKEEFLTYKEKVSIIGVINALIVNKAERVGSEDIEITDNTKGIILKSENETRYRIKVLNDGTLTTEEVA